MKNTIFTISLIIFLSIVLVGMPIQAEEKDDDLEWRLELIQESQNMMEKENVENLTFHKVGTVFTSFGEANINTGLRVAPYVWKGENSSIHLMGELFYLRQEDSFASFISAYGLINDFYFGGGAAITDRANYHIFTGYELTRNIFVEARAINTGSNFESSKVYPVVGFQMNF